MCIRDRVTTVKEETDVNHLYDLKGRLDEFQVYWVQEIDEFANIYFDPDVKQDVYKRQDFISEFTFAIPSNDEQQSIVQHIETECSRIDFKKARTEELIELLTEYRTALISEVVTGKIKVIED